MTKYGWENNILKLTNQIHIPVNSLAFTRGYGAFEYLRTYEFCPFMLNEHLKRLQQSCSLLKLPLPISIEQLEQMTYELIRANDCPNIGIKFFITANSDSPYDLSNTQLYILPSAIPKRPEKALRLGLCSQQRFLPEAKSTCYAAAIQATLSSTEEIDDIVYVSPTNMLLEGSRSNLFLVIDNELHTAKSGVLEGITRQAVIESSPVKVVQRDLSLSELKHASEAFLTSSNFEILPIASIGEQQFDGSRSVTEKVHMSLQNFIIKQTEVSSPIMDLPS